MHGTAPGFSGRIRRTPSPRDFAGTAAIAPPSARLGIDLELEGDLDNDRLGTFKRETPRAGSIPVILRAETCAAMELTELHKDLRAPETDFSLPVRRACAPPGSTLTIAFGTMWFC